jgi:hypothetical protein
MNWWRKLKAWWKRNEYRGIDGERGFHGSPGHGRDGMSEGSAGWGPGGNNP